MLGMKDYVFHHIVEALAQRLNNYAPSPHSDLKIIASYVGIRENACHVKTLLIYRSQDLAPVHPHIVLVG